MATLNKVMLLGNVTKDPELRYTPKGTPVTGVGMALNEKVSDGNGGRTERTTFVEVTFWDKAAEIICQYVRKGHLFYAEGSLIQVEQVVHKDTPQERREKKTKVNGSNFQLMPNRRDHEEEYVSASRPAAPNIGGKASPAPPPGHTDGDEIDF